LTEWYCLICGKEFDSYNEDNGPDGQWCKECNKLNINKYLTCCEQGKDFTHIEYRGNNDMFRPAPEEKGYHIIDDEQDYCMAKINYCPFCGKKL
jgi:DNA-directed RNA polymerase subunit RPC12/RpoP